MLVELKTHILSFTPGCKSKYLQFHDTEIQSQKAKKKKKKKKEKRKKKKRKEKKNEHKMASLEKLHKCRYDSLAFT